MNTVRRYFTSFLGVAALLAASVPDAAAQTSGAARAEGEPVPESSDPPVQARGAAFTEMAPAVRVLDAPVERSAYPLGPGDIVSLSVFGDVSFQHALTVSPEGTVTVPSVGVTRVLGLNLDEAEARVNDLVLRYYRNVDVSLTLSEVRSFKIFVVGQVPNPGVRVANAATRVSEVVPDLGSAEVRPRNLLLRRSSGDTLTIDLVRFLQTGDLASNPTLREGDALVVPAVDETVQVFGRAFFPGAYQYRRGESLAELLSVANGSSGFPSNAADTVRLTRFTDRERRELHVFSRSEALGDRGRGFVLQPFDAIYIPEVSNFKEQKTVAVQGQVVRPGTYPIEPNRTTVRDLVALAGGITPEASLVGATLRREPRDGGQSRIELLNTPPEFLTKEELRILHIRSRGDESNVVVDFQRLFAEGEDALDQTLRDGDVLMVPRAQDQVAVLGAVRQPGVVQHVPGRGADYFVALAGGYSRLANRGDAVVLKAKLGTPVDLDDAVELEPGDQIVIPFRERRTFLETISATNSVLGTVSGFVVTVLALTRLFNND